MILSVDGVFIFCNWNLLLMVLNLYKYEKV